MTEIADIIANQIPDGELDLSASDFREMLLDGGQPSDCIARMRGIYSEIGVYLIGGSPFGNGGYAVAPTGEAPGSSRARVRFFYRDGEPFSQGYARALLFATRMMAEEVEQEEI